MCRSAIVKEVSQGDAERGIRTGFRQIKSGVALANPDWFIDNHPHLGALALKREIGAGKDAAIRLETMNSITVLISILTQADVLCQGPSDGFACLVGFFP
jgi:hypothetical protein